MRLAGDRSYGPRQVLRDGPPQPERMTSTAGQWLARPEIGGHTRRQQVMPLSHGSLVADAGAVHAVRAAYDFVVLPAVAIELLPSPQLRVRFIANPRKSV